MVFPTLQILAGSTPPGNITGTIPLPPFSTLTTVMKVRHNEFVLLQHAFVTSHIDYYTTSCMAPALLTTQRHDSFFANESMTTSLLQYATHCTGKKFSRESSIRCVCLYTSACIKQHPSTCLNYVF